MKRRSSESEAGLSAAVARGAEAWSQWNSAGELISTQELADHWGISIQELELAVKRGALTVVEHAGRDFHPAEFMRLSRRVVDEICSALKELSPVSQLVFWKRRHGALDGKSVCDFLDQPGSSRGQVTKVVTLAAMWTKG